MLKTLLTWFPQFIWEDIFKKTFHIFQKNLKVRKSIIVLFTFFLMGLGQFTDTVSSIGFSLTWIFHQQDILSTRTLHPYGNTSGKWVKRTFLRFALELIFVSWSWGVYMHIKLNILNVRLEWYKIRSIFAMSHTKWFRCFSSSTLKEEKLK